MKPVPTSDEKILNSLQRITALLEDSFILEASRIGMRKDALRDILRIDKKRIGRIAKHVKEQE